MNSRLALLKAEIKDEWTKLERLRDELQAVRAMLDRPENEVPAYDRAAIGYFLHNFYNGCESIFRSIARFFENDLAPGSWHSDLLKRMKLEIPGFRPAVIDEELFHVLEDFRGFRHKFRYSYSFELDWEKERLVALKFPPAFENLKTQLDAFLSALDRLEI